MQKGKKLGASLVQGGEDCAAFEKGWQPRMDSLRYRDGLQAGYWAKAMQAQSR